MLARKRGDCTSGAFAPRERDRRDPRIRDDLLHVAAAPHDRREDTFRKPGVAKNPLDRQRAARHVGGVLQNDDVARGERRRGSAKCLPERKVPRHDREQYAERPEADVAFRGVRRHDLVGEIPGAVLRVVIASERTLFNFGLSLDDRLAHFVRRQLPQLRFASAQR